MSDSKSSGRVVSLMAFAALVLNGQSLTVRRTPDNLVPLKNWTAPLYFQPNQAERGASARELPRLQFSANALSSALTFIAITPCRLIDTRGLAAGFNGDSPFSGPSIPALGTATFPVQLASEAMDNTTPAPCGVIPSIAQAYSLNLTVVPVAGGSVSYVSLWPSGSPQPFVATLNDPQGAIAANAAIVPAGTPSGGISVYNNGPAATDVVIDMNGYFAAPTDLNANTAIGFGTLASNTTGNSNTATGVSALFSNTTGSGNTATGGDALQNNTTGGSNTATGTDALQNNTTGDSNTANGSAALASNTTGDNNTANGASALLLNTTGGSNTATGQAALQSNTTGSSNTASGLGALGSNTTGNNNMASGVNALLFNTTGSLNTASGAAALVLNTTGSFNTASGVNALVNNITGIGNIAIGYQAAFNVASGNSGNIHIGSQGSFGDSATIRIGQIQTSFFAAGVSGVTTGLAAVPVLIDGNGQLGTVSSSIRFKEDVEDMAEASSGLLRLRPVTFRYKKPYADGSKPIDYGLIAEEVAEVYPDLVVKSADGQIQTVQYQKLTPMLLNEVQKQRQQMEWQAAQMEQQQELNGKLEARLAALEALLATKAEPTAAADQ
jgi:hypothetical protein